MCECKRSSSYACGNNFIAPPPQRLLRSSMASRQRALRILSSEVNTNVDEDGLIENLPPSDIPSPNSSSDGDSEPLHHPAGAAVVLSAQNHSYLPAINLGRLANPLGALLAGGRGFAQAAATRREIIEDTSEDGPPLAQLFTKQPARGPLSSPERLPLQRLRRGRLRSSSAPAPPTFEEPAALYTPTVPTPDEVRKVKSAARAAKRAATIQRQKEDAAKEAVQLALKESVAKQEDRNEFFDTLLAQLSAKGYVLVELLEYVFNPKNQLACKRIACERPGNESNTLHTMSTIT
ncbi:hypothetical protein FA95DRAFT_1642246 [Auriscalpium vulgare]|uniref:Uncharacterized protein n=1 Tax=Auriscalpium vulgare TaxID=40419 RepID=A0ACB8RB69_9AGAM|nr:hypothetical protein FA95DRAFT_1642246 [Auriscalpium vulgare]